MVAITRDEGMEKGQSRCAGLGRWIVCYDLNFDFPTTVNSTFREPDKGMARPELRDGMGAECKAYNIPEPQRRGLSLDNYKMGFITMNDEGTFTAMSSETGKLLS
jgi:hypothetical protein